MLCFLISDIKGIEESSCTYTKLSGVVNYEGTSLPMPTQEVTTYEKCAELCDQTSNCQNIRYCPDWSSSRCMLWERKIPKNEPVGTYYPDCFTSYKSCEDGNSYITRIKIHLISRIVQNKIG